MATIFNGGGTRPLGHKTYEDEFVLILEKTANQDTVSYKQVKNGQFCRTSTTVLLKSFMIISSEAF